MGEDTSIRVTEELADELFDRKKRGETYEDVIWRLIEQADVGGAEPASETEESREDPALTPAPQPEEEGVVDDDMDVEALLRSLDLPGSGSKYEARVETVLAFYEYLREHAGERVSKGDLEVLVEDRDLDVAYASFGSFWGNWVKKNESQGRGFNTLTQLPGVEMDGDDYIYTRVNDE
ncbi:hypothetical protein [Halorubrum sp. BV1]|uniref:hypothetical protein n=1 Tax=Halorubrum sp. BV1 TaxID=1498500 RepID=UPI000AD62989|nr:hypothetical protein [Halorubrum sp. BV1]